MRAQLVEAMRGGRRAHRQKTWGCPAWCVCGEKFANNVECERHVEREVLAAQEAYRAPCPTCGGSGHYSPGIGTDNPNDYGRECSACGGSGVSGVRLALVADGMRGLYDLSDPDRPRQFAFPMYRIVEPAVSDQEDTKP